jgi:C-terminal processing protease CtpA/Prc
MKKISLLFLYFILVINGISQINTPNTIDKDQKIYELSMVWKEVSYNFDNFDNCPDLDVDSLYRAYIPIISNTKSDVEYYYTMRRFMAHFNNAHTYVYGYKFVKDILFPISIKPVYRNNKVYIDNISTNYADQLHIGDEIISINGIPAVDFFMQEIAPYVPASNEDDKIHLAMFFQYYPENTKFTFNIATANEIKDIELTPDKNYANHHLLIDDYSVAQNKFVLDSVQKVAYIRLVENSLETSQYFTNHIVDMNKCNTIVLDLSYDEGGSATYNDWIYNYLIKKDSIEGYPISSRIHIPLRKGQGCAYCKDSVKNDVKNDSWCSQCKGTVFESVGTMNFNGKMLIDTTANFKGKVFVITGMKTASAGEDLVTMLSQDEKITFWGSKTCGATGIPYTISLPSGLFVTINTLKTFDFKGNDISSGFSPDYKVDFYDCYKTTDPQQLLDCMMNTINSALQMP